MASCSAVCSQSVLSSLEALTELSCILSGAGPASRGLKGEVEGWGWGVATTLILNHFKQMRKPASCTVPFLLCLQKVCFLINKLFTFFILFSRPKTPGKIYVPFQSHEPSSLSLNVSGDVYFLTRSNQLHYCPVLSIFDTFPSLFFSLATWGKLTEPSF